MIFRATLASVALLLAVASASAQLAESGPWPADGPSGERIAVRSTSPFALYDAALGNAPATEARVTFTPAVGASAGKPSPAVVLLHGAGGVSSAREGRYAREFAAQGVAVAVVDVFGARNGGGFMQRLVNVTEAMALADAFAARDWLAARPDVDGDRIAIIGFSYGGMSATYAAYRQVVDAYGAQPFAAHVAFYGPCIARFEDVTATGAPLLMLWGEQDAIIDPDECIATAADLERGGSAVEITRYDARHRWDGRGRNWRAPAHIADCRFRVGRDGAARDENTFFVMDGPVARAAMLGLCLNRDGYLIGADEAVRERSNARMAQFLNPVLFPPGD
ncbi:dienelactone hydrolase family protein [Acuticoccus sp. MNP-M23]|uniref:dienelactone hydrolase family protein n=1 Tax=Acuticoccus sp. MNP-M23 TaxID=3072793 RepID=UPI0028152C93|nr:alpha/beta fold hydrolase [Acuticoccus sp. MNP-M23]WMS42687.1 dienelactone hydrolase family protein [Acuticoccus sp. MNP-M23]